MKGLLAASVGIVLAFSITGSAADTTAHEKTFKGMIKIMNDLADVLESVKDQDTAKIAAGNIEKICDRFEALAKTAEKLPKLSKEDDDKLTKQFDPDMKKVEKRLQDVAFKSGVNSGGEPTFINSLKRLEVVGKKMQKIGKN